MIPLSGPYGLITGLNCRGRRMKAGESCISASDMHSNKSEMKNHKSKLKNLYCFLFVIFIFMIYTSSLSAGIKDRVAAYVDNTAITLSELEKKYAETVLVTPAVTREEVLDTMINRLLFVREARKIRLKSELEDALLKEYVDLKIRAFIRIKDEEIRTFFDTHASDFLEKELDEMREDIENYLIEQAVNKRLKEHIAELRNNACVKIQLNRQNQE
jgi:hypothetical protein